MLESRRYFIKEHVTVLRTYDTYDIFDADSGHLIGMARESISGLVAALRWVIGKNLMPTTVEVRSKPEDRLIFRIRRGIHFLKATVEVEDGDGQKIGYFRSKLFTFSGGFQVYTVDAELLAEVKGTLLGFHYRFVTPEGAELGEVSKQFEGLGKELFTSADSYLLRIREELQQQPVAKILLLAAALAIDIVFKEHN